jgi:hypothetical protein
MFLNGICLYCVGVFNRPAGKTKESEWWSYYYYYTMQFHERDK